MDINFKEDENGKIADSDELFDKIDGLLDNEEYDAAVKEILSIPREKWSNKLRFRLINAYSNQNDLDKARKELDETAALCDTPNDNARCHYLFGYLCEMSDNDIMAREHYRKAAEIDPEYAKEIDLEDDINECAKNVAEALSGFHSLCDKAAAEIKQRCAEATEKRDIPDEQFQTRLGYFPGIRKLPGFEHCIGFENYFVKYNGKDKENCLKWFGNFYGITDKESFFQHIQNDIGCNNARMVYDVSAYFSGKPNFDVSELDEGGRIIFENVAMFVSAFIGYLPGAGVLAWDLCEKIGFARHAYGCGIISDIDYRIGMRNLSDTAKRNFSSWEEYMISLIFGAALYMFITDEWSISSASDFVSTMLPILLQGDLAELQWHCLQEPTDCDN